MQYVTIEKAISLTDLDAGQSRPVIAHGPRSKGVHLTEITQRANRESGRLKEAIIFGRNSFAPIDEEDLPAAMALGMAWEDALMKMCPWMERIGEVLLDGIAMSPDAVTRNDHRHLLSPGRKVLTLDEIKLTYKSSAKILEEHVGYLQQTKSYCHALGTPYCRLNVMHVNGNYRFGDDPAGGPHFYQHHIMYSVFELQTNWSWVKRKKLDYGL